MSNVVQLFKPRPNKEADMKNISHLIVDWAEEQGVDINDPVFTIRCADVLTLLQVIVNECKI